MSNLRVLSNNRSDYESDAEYEARYKILNLLEESDYTQLDDSIEDKSAWATYRQELRNVILQPGFPDEIVWPIEP
jgi:hypothetical protein